MAREQIGVAEEWVTFFASGADAEQIRSILEEAHIACAAASAAKLADMVQSGEPCAAIVDASLLDEDLVLALRAVIADQAAWSNFPFILLMDRGSASPHSRLIQELGNVGVVERPLDPAILVPNVRSALRSRRRQREAEAYLAQREEAEARLQQLTETLEARVRARTEDLRSANERLLLEIDERRNAEEQLRESEELYRFTVELSQQLVWTASPDGRMLSLSPRFSQITGLGRDVDPHEGWLSVMHPDDAEGVFRVWEETRRSVQPKPAEFRMRLADGSYRRFLARAAPRIDEAGNVIRWYGFTEDVEDQRRAEAARRAAEERYRLAARATNDVIWDLELSTSRIHWSDSAADALGYPGRKLGTTALAWWEERVHPEDRQQATSSLDEAVNKGKTRWSATYRFRQANGEYATFFDRGFIVRNDKGEAARFVGAMTDLTDRQRAEEEIRRMQAELIHVSRLSAMGTMASTLAHELNQPLTAVANYVRGSQRLLESGEESRIPEVRKALEAAEAGALRGGQIVRRLRELVARGNAALRPEELSKLIEDAGAIAFLDAHLLGVTHRIELDPAAQWVEVDRIQIQQVFINLIRNAMQAMQEVDRREILVSSCRTSPEQVEISVSDTGVGIAPGVRDALFSAFHGTKPEGMGIGLSISRTIIEAHGGKIWAEDCAGGGTVFRFTLPAWEELEPREEQRARFESTGRPTICRVDSCREANMGEQQATLAGGCFWCTEAIFNDVVGVSSVESGYIGGNVTSPTYKQVCGGDTGHAEAVRLTFDPSQISYDDLLDIYFATHDPTQLNRQGNDVGTQYRSAIFPHSPEQEAAARAAIERAQADWDQSIVTTVEPLSDWYPAEDYHQEYFEREGENNPYCMAVVAPKLRKFRKSYAARLKNNAAAE